MLRRPDGCTCIWSHSSIASYVYLADPDCPAAPHSRQIVNDADG